MVSLLAYNIVILEKNTSEKIVLTPEGNLYLLEGSPEAQVFHAIPPNGISQNDLMKSLGKIGKVGFAQCMKKKWCQVKEVEGKKLVFPSTNSVDDDLPKLLECIQKSDHLSPADLNLLKKRKLVSTAAEVFYTIHKGPDFVLERKKPNSEISFDMLQSGSWKNSTFKSLNLKAKGKELGFGALHPLLKVRTQFRSILLEMGFEEMPTNNFVESSFWNFDTLFQPQQHPARDAHDTFFLSEPENAKEFPTEYLERVKAMHEQGDANSIGWRYDWKIEEAQKNIMRTHTTAVSSRMLYELAQKPFEPKKYFSIDRVFRNETVDFTHLAEFHQIEGLVADRNLTLGDLIGTIKTFFERIGIDDVKFKPAYNPYTEPSMEIFGYSKELDRWIEIGNSGIFRPEMLKPMGLPDDVRVIAWGLSLERPTMIKYSIGNIRDLCGHKVDLKMVQSNPVCRF